MGECCQICGSSNFSVVRDMTSRRICACGHSWACPKIAPELKKPVKKEGSFSPLSCGRVIDEVFEERQRQDEKWGQQNHNVPEWLMILGEEVGEANKEGLEIYFKNKPRPMPENAVYEPPLKYTEYRKELIQIAAVAVAMVESLDRNGK